MPQEGGEWGPCKVPGGPEAALAFSRKACTGILPKGHYTSSTTSSCQAAHELACQVGRTVHLGVRAIHSEGTQFLAGP